MGNGILYRYLFHVRSVLFRQLGPEELPPPRGVRNSTQNPAVVVVLPIEI